MPDNITSNGPYNLFIGRWQTPKLHAGHLWCFQQSWDKNEPVLIAIRDIKQRSQSNPYTALEVYKNVTDQLRDKIESGLCQVIIIPDIKAVLYGRGVGYEVKELMPPDEIASVSATRIRQELNKIKEDLP